MKTLKNIFAILTLCVGIMATATSCNDNDKDEPDPIIDPVATPAQFVEGAYTGAMTCAIMGQTVNFEDMTFNVTAVSDSTADVTIPSFSYSGYASPVAMVIPEITVKDVKISGKEAAYTFAKTDFEGTNDAGKKYSGSLAGTLTDNQLALSFSVTLGSMPMPMICSFNAPKN